MAESPTNEPESLTNVPTGTVTFLFTDIQGSTQLLERLRDQYALVLAEQRDVLRTVFARWNGHEIDTQGDAFFVAFPRALDAVNCAVEVQCQHELEAAQRLAETEQRAASTQNCYRID